MGRERSVGYADVKQALSNSTGSPRYHRFTPPAVRPTYKWTRGVRLKGRSSDAGWLGFVVGLSSYDPRAGACPSAHSESPIWVMSKIRPSGPRGAGPRLLTNPYKSVNIVLATIDGVGRAPWFPSRPCSAGPIALKLLTFEYSVAALEGSAGAPLTCLPGVARSSPAEELPLPARCRSRLEPFRPPRRWPLSRCSSFSSTYSVYASSFPS